jgi:hypothetical protein
MLMRGEAGFCVLDPSAQKILRPCHVSRSNPKAKEIFAPKGEESWSMDVCCLSW